MSEYNLKFTDVNVPSISIDEKEVDHNSVDITLFGFKRLEYGERLNENFVHLLEHFASLEDAQNPDNPDTAQTIYISPDNLRKLLDENKEVIGQLWYNKTNLSPYVFHSNIWNMLENFGEEIAANWGQIANGEQIPQPVSESGYVFPYAECSWIVSPFNQLDELEEMVCRTDENAVVEMEYLFNGQSVKTAGVANYMIVGIRGNNNLGDIIIPNASPTPTPTPTPSISNSATPGASPTPTPTPTPSESGLTSLTLTMNDPYNASCEASISCTALKSIVAGTDYTIQGGSGNYNYSWGYSSGAVFSINDPTIPNPKLSRNRNVGNTAIGFGSLTVTDNVTTQTATKLFTFSTRHIDNSTPDPSSTPTPTATPTPSVSDSATPGASSTPTPTPTPTATPTPTPSVSDSATPTPTPTSDTTGNVKTGNVGNTGTADPNSPIIIGISLQPDGTVFPTGGEATNNGFSEWIEGGAFQGTEDGSDYTYTIGTIQSNVNRDPALPAGSWDGPTTGSTGNLGTQIVYRLSGPTTQTDISLSAEVFIDGPRNSGMIQMNLLISAADFGLQ